MVLQISVCFIAFYISRWNTHDFCSEFGFKWFHKQNKAIWNTIEIDCILLCHKIKLKILDLNKKVLYPRSQDTIWIVSIRYNYTKTCKSTRYYNCSPVYQSIRAFPHFGWFSGLRFASVETNLRGNDWRCRGPLANTSN
jgi:hypothetical protein